MNKRASKIELLLVAGIIIVILLSQIVGTTSVSSDDRKMNDEGYPATDMTLEDLDYPGVKIAVLTGTDWAQYLEERFPEAEIITLNSGADIYNAIDTGTVDAGVAFESDRDELLISHPDIALIDEPFTTLSYGFGTQNTPEGSALCDEFNSFLAGRTVNLKPLWKNGKAKTGKVMSWLNMTSRGKRASFGS